MFIKVLCLEQIDQYENLWNVLLQCQVLPFDRAYQWSECKGTNVTADTRTGAPIMSAVAAGPCPDAFVSFSGI